MVDKPNPVAGTGITTQPAQQFTLTSDQFRELLTMVRDYRVAEFAPLHQLNDSQKVANKLFEQAAAGLAVTGFGAPISLPERKNGKLIIDVPNTATRVVVYEQSGVRGFDVDGSRQTSVEVSAAPTNRVGRVEFFDRSAVLLKVTGGEPPPPRTPLPAPTPPTYAA